MIEKDPESTGLGEDIFHPSHYSYAPKAPITDFSGYFTGCSFSPEIGLYVNFDDLAILLGFIELEADEDVPGSEHTQGLLAIQFYMMDYELSGVASLVQNQAVEILHELIETMEESQYEELDMLQVSLNHVPIALWAAYVLGYPPIVEILQSLYSPQFHTVPHDLDLAATFYGTMAIPRIYDTTDLIQKMLEYDHLEGIQYDTEF